MSRTKRENRYSDQPFSASHWLCLVVISFAYSINLFGQVQDSFESSEVVWQRVESDGQVVTTSHGHDQKIFHHGRQSEYLELIAGQSTHIHYAYNTPQIRLIDELNPSIWIRANRNHVQIIGTVVLPRTIDPQTKKPLQVQVYGDAYTTAGSWQKLTISNIYSQLKSKVPSLRSQHGPNVSAGQAYISNIMLNTYSAPGMLQLWIDEFEMQTPRVTGKSVTAANYQQNGSTDYLATSENENQIEIQESVLLVNGFPYMPKVIEHNGEPLELLQSLGFNTAALKQFPTIQQLETARRIGLKLIAPPNLSNELTASANLSPLLCWNLGNYIRTDDLLDIKNQTSHLNRLPVIHQRPTIGTIQSGFQDISRYTDICQLSWQPLFSGLNIKHSTQQLLQAIGELRRGRNVWVKVPSQIPETVLRQQHALVRSQPEQLSQKRLSTIVSYDQLSMIVNRALAAGARGIQIQSLSRLDQTDEDTLQRRRILERVNNELDIIAPWIAGGTTTGQVKVNRNDITVYMTQTNRARLLWVFSNSEDQQIVSLPVNKQVIEFNVPGVPVTYRPYHIGFSGIKRLRGSREASNLVSLSKESNISRIVLTADPLVRDFIQRKIYEHRTRTLQLTYDLLQQQLVGLYPLTKIRSPKAVSIEGITIPYAQAQSSLQKARKHVSINEWDVAFQLLSRAEDLLRQSQLAAWNHKTTGQTTGNPLTLGITSLPEYFLAQRQLLNSNWSANQLTAGSMEMLNQVQAAGWQHHRHPQHVVQSLVELTPHFPREGESSLRLQAWTTEQASTPSFLEAPVWITSPEVPVRQGEVLHIRGWINITEPLQHHGDGLVVYDSIGGISMGDRFHHTTGWQPFSLIRVAPQDGTVQLTFALMGLGEVSIDNITIQKQISHLTNHSPIQLNHSNNTSPTTVESSR
ncbi:MAG: hypothetical protein CMJ76_06635 [Planctomycetaceae bacterium]|nr:hypothetical protein [Planctomycetaceae bacterium]